MPLFIDHHRDVEGLTAEVVAEAHKRDLEVQDKYGVKYHRYWYNEETGEVFCLVEAPNAESGGERPPRGRGHGGERDSRG